MADAQIPGLAVLQVRAVHLVALLDEGLLDLGAGAPGLNSRLRLNRGNPAHGRETDVEGPLAAPERLPWFFEDNWLIIKFWIGCRRCLDQALESV